MIDGNTNGQFTSSAALPCSSASRDDSSVVWVIDGSAPGAVATSLMICSALTVAARCEGVSVNVTVFPSSERTWPPALSSNVLYQTTRPSYCLPCTAIQLVLPSPCRRVASATIAFQSDGGVVTKSARYHSNWVFVVIGAAYIWPFHSAVFSGPGRVSATASASAWPAGSSDSGNAHPASANSAVQITSSAITSSVWSLPVRRRASCSRWSSAPLGRLNCWMVNRPSNWSLHCLAIAAKVLASPAGVYKLITTPFLFEPHAETTDAIVSAATRPAQSLPATLPESGTTASRTGSSRAQTVGVGRV